MKAHIQKVAVLGSGVMGSAIAAQLAGCGVSVVLLDILNPNEPTEAEKKKGLNKDHPDFRNSFAKGALEKLAAKKPALIYSPSQLQLIKVGNFADHFEWVKDCQWIIEVVKEDLKIKKEIFAKILTYWKPGMIVTSNTSGISIDAMVEGLPADFAKHVFGTHFFNPVRYMHLLEVIPGTKTDRALQTQIEEFCANVLGKGTVEAKNTPNFVANRIGVHFAANAIHKGLKAGFTIPQIDTLTGPVMAKPNSGTFKTMDLVGLDTLAYILKNTKIALPHDESREVFNIPPVIDGLVASGAFGDKVGKGFYFKTTDEKGKTLRTVYNTQTLAYEPFEFASYEFADKIKNKAPEERLKLAVSGDSKEQQFILELIVDGVLYAANRIPEIAHNVESIDNAMKWGFNWELGPFECWEAVGFTALNEQIKKMGRPMPQCISTMLEKGLTCFYKVEKGQRYCLNLSTFQYEPSRVKGAEYHINTLRSQKEQKYVAGNKSATLWNMGDDVALMEFHTKLNAIDDDIIALGFDYLEKYAPQFRGLVVGNQGSGFSAGANLKMIAELIEAKNWGAISQVVRRFQKVAMAFKYAPFPVVTAPFGLTLGGGAEIAMHGNIQLVHTETYLGLVELGVGLIPAGGGTTETALRAVSGIPSDVKTDLLPLVQKHFETIAMAKVSSSAHEAIELGLLNKDVIINTNKDHLLADAKALVLNSSERGFQRKFPAPVRVLGVRGMAALRVGLESFAASGFMSHYDLELGMGLAKIFCGGEVAPGSFVTEQDLLDLEHEVFLEFCGKEKTKERILGMLKTGKPVRN